MSILLSKRTIKWRLKGSLFQILQKKYIAWSPNIQQYTFPTLMSYSISKTTKFKLWKSQRKQEVNMAKRKLRKRHPFLLRMTLKLKISNLSIKKIRPLSDKPNRKSIRLSIRLRCAKIGSRLGYAVTETSVNLLTEIGSS